MSRVHNLLKRSESGQSLIFVAVMGATLMGIMGLAVLGGHVFVEFRRMQAAADMAAIVGAQKLPCDTTDDHANLGVGPKDWQDDAKPSGNAMAATVLLTLGAYTGDSRYTEEAERALQLVQNALAVAPTGFAQWLCGLDFALGPTREIAIVGGRAEAQKLLDVVFGEYRPNQVVALAQNGDESAIPLLKARTRRDGHATAYVCQHFACQMPVTEPDALAAQLQAH